MVPKTFFRDTTETVEGSIRLLCYYKVYSTTAEQHGQSYQNEGVSDGNYNEWRCFC